MTDSFVCGCQLLEGQALFMCDRHRKSLAHLQGTMPDAIHHGHATSFVDIRLYKRFKYPDDMMEMKT